jgi:hypothetical protein
MHEQGYDFFTLPRLTWAEIQLLIDAFNRREKRKAEEYERMKKKSKRH